MDKHCPGDALVTHLRVYQTLVPTGGEGEKLGKPTNSAKSEHTSARSLLRTSKVKVTSEAQEEEDDHYVVEKILSHEWNPNLKTQRFYVKWKGYPDSDNSWVKQEDFDDRAILKKYWKETNARITSTNQKPLSKLTLKKRKTINRKVLIRSRPNHVRLPANW